MKSLTPYNCQNINQDDINSVIKVLKSSLITQGEEVLKFEKKNIRLCKIKICPNI